MPTTCLSPFHSSAPVSPPSLYVLKNPCLFLLSCHFRGDSRRGEGKHVFNLPLLIKSFSISLCLFLNIYLAALVLSCGRWDRWAQLPQGMRDLSSLARDGTHIPCIKRYIFNHWTIREVLSLFRWFLYVRFIAVWINIFAPLFVICVFLFSLSKYLWSTYCVCYYGAPTQHWAVMIRGREKTTRTRLSEIPGSNLISDSSGTLVKSITLLSCTY